MLDKRNFYINGKWIAPKKQNDFINLSMGGVYLSNTISPFDTIFTLK